MSWLLISPGPGASRSLSSIGGHRRAACYKTATASLAHGSEGCPFTFAIQGTGGAPALIAAFSLAILDFAVAAGKSGSASFQIQNQGYGPLTGTVERNSSDTWYAARSGEAGGPPDRDWVSITSPTTLASTDGAWIGRLDDALTDTLNLPFPFQFYGTSYTKFHLTNNGYFGLTTATGDAADLADPDGDGLSNLLKYALGGKPLDPADSPRPLAQISNAKLQISFPRARADVSYTVEASGDLSTWSPVNYTPSPPDRSKPSPTTRTPPLCPGAFCV